MNLHCLYCQTPFTLSMNEKIGALRQMRAENMHHYDAYCPRCRRANSVSRERLEMFTPGWQQAIAAPAQSAPPDAPTAVTPKIESAPAPIVSPSKPRHSSAAKKAKAAAKPKAAKPAASKTKPAPSKPASKTSNKKVKGAVKKSKGK